MGDNALSGLLPGGSESLFLLSETRFDGKWSKCEIITATLIQGIQPSRSSEVKRLAIIDYVERLIARHFNCQVSTYGSVPLKTYLPEGDIDLSTFTSLPHSSEIWANELRHVLKREQRNKHSKFCVREVQIINAEVQIVKCLVDNVIVDISFNQLGGISTLCFLEEVDRLIGRDHLFKRSIILVKAWCYYESRILGAHHGLISTYALETLVLYIFNIFHASLRGPFEVLFKFLQFFSQFDWKQYCVSLWGPIRITTSHEMSVEQPNKNGNDLLFSHDFLSECSLIYGVPVVGPQYLEGRNFSSKNMNVVDPLRFDNNLGRSVNRGNFFRICSAFAYGAKQIQKLFHVSSDDITENLGEFFGNTKKYGISYGRDEYVPRLTHVPFPATLRLPQNFDSSGSDIAHQSTENLFRLGQGGDEELARAYYGSSVDLVNGMHFTLAEDKVDQLTVENVSAVLKNVNEWSSEKLSKPDILKVATRKFTSSNNSNGVFKNASHLLSDTSHIKFKDRESIENARDLLSTSAGCNSVSHGASSSTVVPIDDINITSPFKRMMGGDLSVCTNNLSDSHILKGDLGAYLMNLRACRWMAECQFYAPVTLVPSIVHTGSQFFESYSCEGPGRPGNENKKSLTQQGFTQNYGQYINRHVEALSLQNAFGVPCNRIIWADFNRSLRGTGTYLPQFQGTGKYRDIQPIRSDRGTWNASKMPGCNGAANHEEGNGSTSRFSCLGGKLEGCLSMNTGLERKPTFEQIRQEKGLEERSPMLLAPIIGKPLVNNASSTSQGAMAVTKHRGREAFDRDTLNSSLDSTVLRSFSNNNENSLLLGSIEFGSLGLDFVDTTKNIFLSDIKRKDHGGWESEGSSSLMGGDRTEYEEVAVQKRLFNENQQSSSKCYYALNEEEFPPLATTNNIGHSNTLSSPKDLRTKWSHLQGSAMDSSAWSFLKSQKNVDR